MKLRESYENPIIQEIYKSYLGAPLSECARNSCTPASTPGRCPMSNSSVCLPLWAGQPRAHTHRAAFPHRSIGPLSSAVDLLRGPS
ncbi:MAG: iron hydrogenase small subunit [Coriobacteriaceae bacterium]